MKRHLHSVLNYFGYFLYAPSFDEIYTFFPQKIGKKDLKNLLMKEIKNKRLISSHLDQRSIALLAKPRTTLRLRSGQANSSQYTLPQYSIPTSLKLRGAGQVKNIKPARTIQTYLSILKWLPFVHFVGITGATAMNGYSSHDDVDLFIITQSGALWTTRFFVVLFAKLLGIYGGFGVCLNLFFDESHLTIPQKKCNSYIAHEILQMKPIIDKNTMYQKFLAVNRWVYNFFPNAPYVTPAKAGVQSINFNSKRIVFEWIPAFAGMTHKIDHLFKSIQLPIIHRNRTGFFLSPTQLWLFKNDFEKKLKRKGLVL